MHIWACNEVDTPSSSSDNAAPHPSVAGKKNLSERWPCLGHRMYLPFRRSEERTDGTTRRGMLV